MIFLNYILLIFASCVFSQYIDPAEPIKRSLVAEEPSDTWDLSSNQLMNPAPWGKRVAADWNKFRGSWGKRQQGQWNNLKGYWGKRGGQWNKLQSAWGKRSGPTDFEE